MQYHAHAAKMTKSKRYNSTSQPHARHHHHHHHNSNNQTNNNNNNNHHNHVDDEFIPLPIQTFLWRQTSPFVRPTLGKFKDLAQIEQRDACKLFERIIITNNIWGQSPSLTDAIASIDRWRLIKVSFPFVLQCTAALLNKKQLKDHNFNKLAGNEAKMMYTLQWILMNASEECAETDNEIQTATASAAMAAASAAASLLRPVELAPLCPSTAAPAVGPNPRQPKEDQVGAVPAGSSGSTTDPIAQAVGNQQTSANVTGPVAASSPVSQQQQSVIIPAAMAAVAIGQPAATASIAPYQIPAAAAPSALSPMASLPPPPPQPTTTKPVVPSGALQNCASNYLLPISSIQMFVYYFAPIMDGLKHSDFLTSNQRLEIGAALWEPLFNHKLPNINCLKAQIKPKFADLLAKLVPAAAAGRQPSSCQLPASAKVNGHLRAQISEQTSSGFMSAVALREADRRRSSSGVQVESQYGDVFMGASDALDHQVKWTSSRESERPPCESVASAPDQMGSRPMMSQHMEQANVLTEQSSATYLDIAVLRCLFNVDWRETGVHWALAYLCNRFLEKFYAQPRGELEPTSGRNRSKSLSHIYSTEFTQSVAIKRDKFKRSHIQEQGNNKQPGGKRNQTQTSIHSIRISTDESTSNSQGEKSLDKDSTKSKTGECSKSFLRVEDAENSDGGDSKEPKSPVRRLSFSSGMQTLANQLRKTSKRVKKSGDGQQVASGGGGGSGSQILHLGGSQYDIHQPNDLLRLSSASPSRIRRSSSADDLTSSQLSNLALLHKSSQFQHSHEKQQITESNPVITVTANAANSGDAKKQHQPTPAECYGSELEAAGDRLADERQQHLIRRLYSRSLRHIESLTRSQSIPRSMRFANFNTHTNLCDKSESIGANHYIDAEGQIDPIVMLKVLHSISQRENACSLRVCDQILQLIQRLVNIGILSRKFNLERRSSQHYDHSLLLPTRQHEFELLHGGRNLILGAHSQHNHNHNHSQRRLIDQANSRCLLMQKVIIDIVFRLNHHMGCPNHCNMDSTVDRHHRGRHLAGAKQPPEPPVNSGATQLRLKMRDLLELVCDMNKQNFVQYVQDVLVDRPLQQIIDILHSILGFCKSDYLSYLKQHQRRQPTATELKHKSSSSSSSQDTPANTAMQPDDQTQSRPAATRPKATDKSELLESIIISNSFKQLITRMSGISKELKYQENARLYCDIRQLISFVRENYCSTFRSIVLSSLIDCARLLSEQQKLMRSSCQPLGQLARAPAELARQPSEEDSSLTTNTVNINMTVASQRGNNRGEPEAKLAVSSHRDSAGTHYADTELTPAAASQSAATLQHQSPLSRGHATSEGHRTSVGSRQFATSSLNRDSATAISSPLKKSYTSEHKIEQQTKGTGGGGGILSLSKAKKKLEQVFGGGGGGGSGGGKPSSRSKYSAGTVCDDIPMHEPGAQVDLERNTINSGADDSRRVSLVGHQSLASIHDGGRQSQSQSQQQQQQQHAAYLARGYHPSLGPLNVLLIKQSQLIYKSVQDGMKNFSFLMESCLPGDFLDPALLAALLDLRSPIAIRAGIFLECANFVHRCNRGHWPSWMRINYQAQQQQAASLQQHQQQQHHHHHHQQQQQHHHHHHHRGSTAGLSQISNLARLRKPSTIQRSGRNNTIMYRAAGRAFYAWAEAVGARLEELLQQEHEARELSKAEAADGDETAGGGDTTDAESPSHHSPRQTCGGAADEQAAPELDFLQPTLSGDSSPFALKMAACQLLFEVTAFLRETYRYLPPSIVQHQVLSSKAGDKISSIYDVSRAVTANRRWSMALSSLGFGQLPASLNALPTGSIAAQPSAHTTRGSTTATIPEQPERRISFVLHETKDEEEERQQETRGGGGAKDQQASAAPTDPTLEHEAAAAAVPRKLTAGRHLSQSSASSAVAVAAATLLRSSGLMDPQQSRRKSIKLRKPAQEKQEKQERRQTKFAHDLEEEAENSSVSDLGLRRTDSMRSRRRVSGISERSDTSERANGTAAQRVNQSGENGQQSGGGGGGDLSGNDSAGNASCDDNYPNEAADKFEADDGKIMSNMPWFKAISMLNSSIDCDCTHFPSCRANCYKLHQNTCKRLILFVQTIYQDPTEQCNISQIFERQLTNVINLNGGGGGGGANGQKHGHESSGSRRRDLLRASSDCSANISGQFGFLDLEQRRKDRKDKDKKWRHNHNQQPHYQPHHQKADSQEAAADWSPAKQQQQHQAVGTIGERRNRVQSMMMHLDSLNGMGNLSSGIWSSMMANTIKALGAVKGKSQLADELHIVKYLRTNVKSLLHCPMSSFLKGAIILPRDNFASMIEFSWRLLLEDDQQLARTAAVCFIISSIKCQAEASKLLLDELKSADASRKMAAISKFYVVWDARYQCWPRLEDGAFVHFKMAPPSIEFTLPSPKIALEASPVVDPPWMPRKTSNVEEVTIGQDQTVQKSFVTATKTRRKQQIELVSKALREKHDKLREDREKFHVTSVPITLYAAHEPTLSSQGAGDELDGSAAGDDDTQQQQQESRALIQMKSAQALFPTCLCQAAVLLINMLDDSRATYEGAAVYELASKVIWSCLVEDPSLFLRYFFERLTRQSQATIFQVLRRLIRFMPLLPPQAAYTLYNYLIGFVIYYIRCPVKSSQKLIADTLSVLCLVVPSVHGLFLKDLKQILRKEQCDHNLLITANVPSAKKIIVHGSDSSGIPSQFPIDESTQFYNILLDSLEFFGIDKSKQNEYFLIDVRTNFMHNLHAYVRDHYSFKRSQHPQLQLINMDPTKAFDILQRQELVNQFLEFGKVSMSLSIVKSSHMAVQRVLFLHEELMKLPTFPRKALETNFSLFRGPLGHQVFSMDRIHKICWVRVIARMFELTSGFFLQLGDIQLFLNAICGIFVLHCDEASVTRLCLATFINAAHQFKSIFSSDGFMPIMATIVQVYSNHQSNQILCRSIEFVCKQFYIMHRKPFLLQLFGSVASRLNTLEILQQNQANHPLGIYQPSSTGPNPMNPLQVNDPSRISPTAFFLLLQSLEKAFKDPSDILELVEAEKPLRAIDFCYQQDKESIEILDIISLCVTVTAYASESHRSTQMLIIIESVVPLYMKYLQTCTSKKAGQSMGKQAHKDELQKIQSISVCIRTLIVNCEGLTRNFSGPMPSIDLRSSSIRRPAAAAAAAGGAQTGANKSSSSQPRDTNNSAGSPVDILNDDPSYTGPETVAAASKSHHRRANEHGDAAAKQTKQTTFAARSAPKTTFNSDESELSRGEFIVPRDTLLNLVAEFLALSTGRLVESAKKYVDLHQKHSSYELLDVKSHLRLAEVANSLLKFASTDPSVMACRGLIRYMNEILPNTEWRQEAIRPALIMILKRLDKTFNRISKKNWVKRTTDWEAAKQLLKGAYLTFTKHPYIVHLPHLKSLISCCQNIIVADGGLQALSPSSVALFQHGFGSSSQQTPSISLLQSSSSFGAGGTQAKQLASGGNFLSAVAGPPSAHQQQQQQQPHVSSSSSAAANMQQQSQGPPSLAAVTAAAALAERLANNVTAFTAVTSQGFNSVTIRLIAMQLLQTGDNQTLESFIGNSMNTPEKSESIMLNLIYPMCIRVCSGAKEAPKLRHCDIMFVLNIVLNMLAPHSASSKSCSSMSSSPKAATDTSQFILSKITTTIGSTQTGATALGIVGSSAHSSAHHVHQILQHHDSLKIGFLGLKILCVCFESQLASEWIRIARVIRDLAFQSSEPSNSLWDFLDFVATYRFPLFILLLPTIKCQLARKFSSAPNHDNAAHNARCLQMIEARIHGPSLNACRSKSFLFVSLTAELRMLKEQLIAHRKQMLDGERLQASSQAAAAAGAQYQTAGGAAHTGARDQSTTGAAGNQSSGGQAESSVASQSAGDHFTAYHRLSAAIASFATQAGTQASRMAAPSTSNQSGSLAPTSAVAALKNTCFAAQLATSAPIGPAVDEGEIGASSRQSSSSNLAEGRKEHQHQQQQQHSHSSIRLSTAKSREEARKLMNTILRRTSYPHNQPSSSAPAQDQEQDQSGARVKLQSPTMSQLAGGSRPSAAANVEPERASEPTTSQIIMDPAMLIARTFPAPRKSTEGLGILKQLVQTIERQNRDQSQQQEQKQKQ